MSGQQRVKEGDSLTTIQPMHENNSSTSIRQQQQFASPNVTRNISSSASVTVAGLSKINDEEALRQRKADNHDQIFPREKVSPTTNEKRQTRDGKKEPLSSVERSGENRQSKQHIISNSDTSQDGDNFVNRDIYTLESGNKNNSTILRDCSEHFPKPLAVIVAATPTSSELRASDNRLNIPALTSSSQPIVGEDIISATNTANQSYQLGTAAGQSKLFAPPAAQSSNLIRLNPGDSRRVRFESLLAPTAVHTNTERLVDEGKSNGSDTKSKLTATTTFLNTESSSSIDCDISNLDDSSRNPNTQKRTLLNPSDSEIQPDFSYYNQNDDNTYSNQDDSHSSDDDEQEHYSVNSNSKSRSSPSYELNRRYRTSFFKKSQSNSFGRRVLDGIRSLGSLDIVNSRDTSSRHPYFAYEDKDLLTGSSKYSSPSKRRRGVTGRTFRGSYRYSRSAVSMAVFNKLCGLLFQRATAALLGAFLIHVTLGTVYTLSNINSYLTSYMRKHGSPNATYGGSMWISSSYAVGQGFSMVLGGYIEKRFSARVACIIGCAMHSISIMSTSWSVDHGPLAVLITYGLIPGFGCGLAYMTPMSNGFGWYPNRKGLVAGVILAGFGIGTFIFNMAQTAYVNADNLSPPEDANGYFTQSAILDKVPHLFVFMGSIYATMQFIGCCLLFKPPNNGDSDHKLLDERPILVESEMSLRKAIGAREFIVLFVVYGVTTQGILFVNSMIKEYGQLFIGNDMYLAWTGSMASIANSMGRLVWGLAIDRFSFSHCFTATTIIFGSLMFVMPFEFVLSSKLWYLVCTLGIFGSFSGWMSIYPVHLSRVFGRTNSGMIYGLIFISQSIGGIGMAFGTHYLIDHFSRFVPFFCVVMLEIVGLSVYHLFYPK